MKKLKRILMCLVLAVTLGLSFTACDTKNNEQPEEEEVYKTESITYAEFQDLLSELNAEMPNGFEAVHKTTYDDGSTETANQIVNISEGEISSSLEVTGNTTFKGYLYGGVVYYEDETSKLYINENVVVNFPNYKTTAAYNYLMYAINPTNSGSEDGYIYSGSLFEKLKDLYAVGDEFFSFTKVYSSKHTNIEVGLADNMKFTLHFEGANFTGLDIWSKGQNFERTTTIKAGARQIQFPNFEEFVFESSDESADDTWSPNS